MRFHRLLAISLGAVACGAQAQQQAPAEIHLPAPHVGVYDHYYTDHMPPPKAQRPGKCPPHGIIAYHAGQAENANGSTSADCPSPMRVKQGDDRVAPLPLPPRHESDEDGEDHAMPSHSWSR